ncbi:MAG: response regulator [Paraperlucidibaca sp.]|jgi:DNA-binding response OmpR family regulator|uniref:response regulator transcription factor n=1 Tax=Paraperlucidibaca sp. TaxID=2708021 RepID=UPI001B60D02A|nr:response regulator [Paraperlucidibaca sp.]MBQ0722937.1 response regulator [Paraperlucidibaca sp.]MBQ0841481.1 response regulator [Paraperlucidibaca sp.]|tara:strand:+ start:172 stop:549 length:378 start_codon:yes stop_codon:yes gene_type:complete
MSRRTILLIEDDELIAGLVRLMVERLGHELVWAPDGEAGKQMLETGSADIVILDILLPYLSGFEVLKSLRANPSTAKLPVLVLTGKTAQADIDRVVEAGADDFLAKPFQPNELSQRLTRLLRRLG